jgi:eukaryotic-like serine/threonine-protein kinase
MTQHNVSDLAEQLTTTAHVPLSERPLVAEDERTVITVPEHSRVDARNEMTPVGESYRQRLFPAIGQFDGDEAGIRLAHFEITSRLGSGGMGAVFKATDLELARDVALKILHPGSSQDASMISRFRNEARACAQLNHDNIARVFYAGSQDGLYFIAYEYATGKTIRDLIIDRGRLSIEDTVNYAIQVTLALNHIAAAGIVHRDIKPSNIMLTNTGRVKVVDLGLARRDTTDSIGDITVAGTTLGTFDYISPEQARDPRNADIRSDIYSLGCTMYHMLTGQAPYPEGTALQKLLDHQGKSPPDPRQLNQGVPPELAAILRKMMANSPEHRYSVPGLLLNDLIQMAARLGLRSIPAEGIVWRKMNAGSDRQPLGAVWVLVSVALICMTAIFLQRSSQSEKLADALVNEIDTPGFEVNPDEYEAGATEIDSTDTAMSTGKDIDSSDVVETGTPGKGASASGGTAGPVASLVNSSARKPTPILPTTGPVSSSFLDVVMSQPGARISQNQIVAEQSNPFILERSDGTVRSFQTLKAAVADARSGDVVLLRYNGFPDDLTAQPPVRIVGMNLIIRAADGFRPTLEFDGVSEGAVSPGRMFNLRSQGSLTMRDIDLRLVVRDDLNTDRWSLFHCEGSNRVNLENVSIECINPDGQPTSIFEMADETTGPIDNAVGAESDFRLTRVICRADATAFRIACQPRGRIQLKDCGFALNGSLLELRGDSSMQPTRGALEVFFDHVTCIHAAPMIHMNDGDDQKGAAQRTLPRISVSSEASVFAGIGMDAKLLASEGNSYLEDIESLVTWNGFTNLYDGYSVFWDIESSALDYSNRRLDFTQWNQFWTNRADSEDTNSSVMPPLAWQRPVWRSSNTKLSLPEMTPSAFELDAALFNSGPLSLPKARDGLIPGVNAQGLPPFPRGFSAGSLRPAATANSLKPSEDPSSPTANADRSALTQPAGINLP